MSERTITCWIITEGKAGTENQCLGLAEALDVTPVLKHFKLRFPWRQLSPWLGFGHQYALTADSPRLDPPYPDLLIASGRKSIGLALHVKKMSGGKTFLVQILDPFVNPKLFDLVVVPEHDPVRGDNVLTIAGALHRVTQEKIDAAKKLFAPVLDKLPHPRVAMMIGGNSKWHRMTPEITKNLTDQLLSLKAGLMVTVSRRTDAANTRTLRQALEGSNTYFWDSEGENPYFALLGFADHIIVTEDSVSMTAEALSTGKPVYTFALEGHAKRHNMFHHMLQEKGYTRAFTGVLEKWSYPPLHDTMRIAQEIKDRMKLKG